MDSVVKGIATIFWASVWADCAEQVDGSLISGKEITEVMPPIPERAYFEAWRLLGKLEATNAVHIATLVDRAIRADRAASRTESAHKRCGDIPKGISPDGWDPTLDAYAERFGNCMAFQYMGDGVSWTDDHAEFDLKVPRGERPYNLEDLAWGALAEAGYERPRNNE